MDNLEEREKSERRAGLACRETWEREVPKASGFNNQGQGVGGGVGGRRGCVTSFPVLNQM